ncbi:MAG TPA: hypothetical protein VHU84_13165, partial [Lacipirellulaceae bacterium]|nr:hypothetical protein [Lacipirellulaceae bacterium]
QKNTPVSTPVTTSPGSTTIAPYIAIRGGREDEKDVVDLTGQLLRFRNQDSNLATLEQFRSPRSQCLDKNKQLHVDNRTRSDMGCQMAERPYAQFNFLVFVGYAASRGHAVFDRVWRQQAFHRLGRNSPASSSTLRRVRINADVRLPPPWLRAVLRVALIVYPGDSFNDIVRARKTIIDWRAKLTDHDRYLTLGITGSPAAAPPCVSNSRSNRSSDGLTIVATGSLLQRSNTMRTLAIGCLGMLKVAHAMAGAKRKEGCLSALGVQPAVLSKSAILARPVVGRWRRRWRCRRGRNALKKYPSTNPDMNRNADIKTASGMFRLH